MNWREYISTDKEVLAGKPAVTGTRLSVDHIVGLFAQGWTEQQVLENYPRLTKEHLKAVFAYVYDCMKDGLLFGPFNKSA